MRLRNVCSIKLNRSLARNNSTTKQSDIRAIMSFASLFLRGRLTCSYTSLKSGRWRSPPSPCSPSPTSTWPICNSGRKNRYLWQTWPRSSPSPPACSTSNHRASSRTPPRLLLSQLLENETSRLVIIVTFLAVLELWKRSHITVAQSTLFSPIVLERGENWSEDTKLSGESEEW